MLVEIGNAHAIEGFREGDDDVVHYRAVPGERVTRIVIPSGIGIQEAYASVVGAMSVHMDPTQKPAWIETDTPGLTALLYEHYGLDPAKVARSPLWGQQKAKPVKKTRSRSKPEVAESDEKDEE